MPDRGLDSGRPNCWTGPAVCYRTRKEGKSIARPSYTREKERFVPFSFLLPFRLIEDVLLLLLLLLPRTDSLIFIVDLARASSPCRLRTFSLLTLTKSVTCQPVRKRNLSSCIYMCTYQSCLEPREGTCTTLYAWPPAFFGCCTASTCYTRSFQLITDK